MGESMVEVGQVRESADGKQRVRVGHYDGARKAHEVFSTVDGAAVGWRYADTLVQYYPTVVPQPAQRTLGPWRRAPHGGSSRRDLHDGVVGALIQYVNKAWYAGYFNMTTREPGSTTPSFVCEHEAKTWCDKALQATGWSLADDVAAPAAEIAFGQTRARVDGSDRVVVGVLLGGREHRACVYTHEQPHTSLDIVGVTDLAQSHPVVVIPAPDVVRLRGWEASTFGDHPCLVRRGAHDRFPYVLVFSRGGKGVQYFYGITWRSGSVSCAREYDSEGAATAACDVRLVELGFALDAAAPTSTAEAPASAPPPDPRAALEARRREIDEVLREDARRHPKFAEARLCVVAAWVEAFGGGALHRGAALTVVKALHRYESLRGDLPAPHPRAADECGLNLRYVEVYERRRVRGPAFAPRLELVVDAEAPSGRRG